jgi:translation initiation factor 1
MSKKNKNTSPYVYSTNPSFIDENAIEAEEVETLTPKEQKLKIKLETKHRGGKTVTLVQNFIGTQADKDNLGKSLKTFCGTGGSVKDDEILVQGDCRDKVLQWLIKNGYTNSKKI